MSEVTQIRRAGVPDANALARARYAFRIELSSPTESEDAFVARCESWMSERLVPGSHWCCWIAEMQSAMVGHVWLQLLEKVPNPVGESELHGYITSLYVAPVYRGRGSGSALIGAAVAFGRQNHVHALFLWPSEMSRPLYARHGFQARDGLLELQF